MAKRRERREAMGRYIKDVQLDQPLDVVSLVMEDYVYHNRFSRTDWNGEMVFYRKDEHRRERYMKWTYAGGLFHVEAWLRNPLGGEMDLDGVGGGASRKEFRQSMDRLIETLKNQSPSGLAGGHVGADPLHHSPDYEAEHKAWQNQGESRGPGQQSPQSRAQGQNQAWEQSRNGNAQTGAFSGEGHSRKYGSSGTSAVICAMAGLIFAGVLPIVGIILGIVGMKKCDEAGANLPRAIKFLCIFVIGISGLWMVGGFLLSFAGAYLLGL